MTDMDDDDFDPDDDWRDDYHDEPISDADLHGAGLLIGIAVARGELPSPDVMKASI